jgi:acyl dehydratase
MSAVGASTVLDAAWYEEVCQWFPCRAAECGPFVWPLLLVPRRIDPGSELQALWPIYLRVDWRTRAVPLRYVATMDVSAAGDDDRATIVARAVEEGTARLLAEVHLVVTRSPLVHAVGHVRHDVPPSPAPSELVASHRRSVLSESEVRRFAEVVGVDASVHADQRVAWSSGFPNLVVPASLLLSEAIHRTPLPDAGSLSGWFRRPVPAGSAVDVRTHESEVTTLVLPAGRSAAAVIAVGSAR